MVRESLVDFLSLAVSAQAAEVFFPTNMFGGICSCRWFALFLHSRLAGLFGLLLVPKSFPVFLGSKILRGNAPRIRAMTW